MLEILYQNEWLVAVNKPPGWLTHRSWLDRDERVVIIQTVRDQIGQHIFTAHRLDRFTPGVLLMGLSGEAGWLLAQQSEQHQIRKRYRAIVRDWLAEEVVLDYPLVEGLNKVADRFTREDEDSQSTVMHYRGLATIEMPTVTRRCPATRYGLVELELKTRHKHQLHQHLVHLRHPIIGDNKHSDLRQNRSSVEHFGLQRLMLYVNQLSLTHLSASEPLTIHAGPDDTWMQALPQSGWRSLLPGNERAEFSAPSGQDGEVSSQSREKTVWRKLVFLSAPCMGIRCQQRKKQKQF